MHFVSIHQMASPE